MTTTQKKAALAICSAIVFGAITNWVSYQFTADYSGPVTATLLILLCTILLKWQNEKWSDLGLFRPKKPMKLLWQVPTILLLTIIAGVVASFFIREFYEIQQSSQSRFEGMEGNFPMFLKWMIIGWIVGGLFEELIFRGFLLNYFERLFYGFKWRSLIAVILQAFLFGLIHFYNRGISGGVPIFAVSLVLGFLYIKFGRNLWPLIIAHGIIDTLSFLEDYIGA